MNRPVWSLLDYCLKFEMKKVLFFLLSMWIMFACGEDKEIPVVTPPIVNPDSNENPKPVEVDSIYYQLGVDGFELIAATNDSTCLFLQTDTTFAFKCLYDSCGTNRLVAYSDSTGMVERIVIDEQVINILYHEDKNKMDIFYKDTEGKMAWIKDVESPYKDLSSRAESDVPYSAISIVNNLSYAVYTILNTYDIDRIKPLRKYTNKYARKETYNMRGTVALELIKQILGKEYKIAVYNDVSQIVDVMSDYAKWVKKELYGDAIPHLRKYASRLSINNLMLNAYVDGVDSLNNEFKVGIIVAQEGEKLDALHFLNNQGSQYNSQKANYPCSFKGLATGKRYRFKPYLAPVSTSKYLTGMKSLLDYYKYGTPEDYLLLETKAEFKSMEDDQATIKLSVENADKRIKIGVIYSEHSDLLKHEYKKVEYEPTFEEGLFSDNFEKEVKLEALESGYTYYMPYVIYDDDILNRPLDYSISSETIYETDMIFYGKKDSINIDPLRKALMQLYKSTNGDNWTHNDNWGSDKPVTEWYGVRLMNSTYQICLDENNLTGKIEQVFPDSIKVSLFISSNQLDLIDVSGSTALRYLSCGSNQLTSLNASGCTVLSGLSCNSNQLKSLKLDGCKSLVELHCSESKLTSLDVSNLTALEYLGCVHNFALTTINASGCTSLVELFCPQNALTSLNLSRSNAIEKLDCAANYITSLDLSGCAALVEVRCEVNKLTSLNVSGCKSLVDLACYSNQLTSLDVSSCTALEYLGCHYNFLTSLDVSNCTALKSLKCSDNQLTSLDVDDCRALESLSCEENKITRVIPDWFSQLDSFSYDKRFEYWRDYIPGSNGEAYEIKHKDKGIGWSYKDEPNAKYSGF